jgi:hypothetical protein
MNLEFRIRHLVTPVWAGRQQATDVHAHGERERRGLLHQPGLRERRRDTGRSS